MAQVFMYLRVSTDVQDVANQKAGVVRRGMFWSCRRFPDWLQVLEIMQECATREVRLHAVKNRIVLDGSLQAKVIATVFGLAAEIERELIAARTREALRKMKAEGAQLGRPKGPAKKQKLDAQAAKIEQYLKLNLDKRAIAKLVGCAPNTLYAWLASGVKNTK